MDVSQINAQLYVGAAITSEADVAQLGALGVSGLVDCRLEFDDRSLVEGYNSLPGTPESAKAHAQMAYLYNGTADDGVPKPVGWFTAAWDFAEPLLAGGGLLALHCAAGVNRGPSLGYYFLRRYWGLSGDNAFGLLRAQRPVVQVAYRASADGALLM